MTDCVRCHTSAGLGGDYELRNRQLAIICGFLVHIKMCRGLGENMCMYPSYALAYDSVTVMLLNT